MENHARREDVRGLFHTEPAGDRAAVDLEIRVNILISRRWSIFLLAVAGILHITHVRYATNVLSPRASALIVGVPAKPTDGGSLFAAPPNGNRGATGMFIRGSRTKSALFGLILPLGCVMAVVELEVRHRRRRRSERGLCLGCGHALGGAATCPECGVASVAAWSSAGSRRRVSSPAPHVSVGVEDA